MRSARFVFCSLAVGVVLLDQLGKWHAIHHLPLGARVPVLGDVLSFAHAPSVGGAFGFMMSAPPRVQFVGFILLSILTVIVVGLFYRGLAPREIGSAAGLGAIFGGALAATMDRIRFGSSFDFIHIGPPSSQMLPDFNLADVGIVLGVVTLIVELLATEMAARASERPRR